MPQPSVLAALVAGLRGGSIDVVDLTAPLSSATPVIRLPPAFGQTAVFELEEISRYDDRGPAWYWSNFRSGEHTGTHFDAPNHWVTGKDLADVASVPASRLRTGWDARADSQEAFLNGDGTGPHTPGLSPDCARWVARESPVIGLGVETVGTDAGAGHSFDPAFPCHSYLMGSDKYGLTQLRNLAVLPPTGSVVVAGPLPIVTGSGAPARVLALVERA
ncbi:cyclase family protein [Streptomyces sp. YKOK-I1]